MNTFQRITTFGLFSVLLFGAGPVSPNAPDKYTPIDVASGGTIRGVVRFDGARPQVEQVDITTKEDVCHSKPVYSEKLVVSKEMQVQWAVVSLTDIKTGKAFQEPEDPKDRPTLDQNGCVFSPHVVLVGHGKPLKLLNSDGVLHNVHTWPKKNRSKNIAMPGPVKELTVKFRRPERIRVSCDIHRWMEAWIVVTEHPYYAVSDEAGEFELTDVPPGNYILRVWHETLGQFDQEVEVKANAEASVEFVLSERGQDSGAN